ncbi:hypothetical protein [Trueperella pyogenes]|uniref:hypothetical protein n=1 Tax=Trueperella pyogenes TaxID=1661 RepID=UPI00345D8AD5
MSIGPSLVTDKNNMTKLRNLTTCSLPLGIQVRSTSFSELDEREQHLPCWQRYRERDTCTKGKSWGYLNT